MNEDNIKCYYLKNNLIIVGIETENEILECLQLTLTMMSNPTTKQVQKNPYCLPLGEPFNVIPVNIKKSEILFEVDLLENTEVIIELYSKALGKLKEYNNKIVKNSKIISNASNVIIPNIRGNK